ncbi:MAG: hypothetical protein IJN83_06875 [Clostridia bacterium]|nr:hypothetical protein [Clostridia bacterium]
MNYALIENGVVVNTIVLVRRNATDFPNAVSIEGLSVQIGDTYDGERFYHDNEPIYSNQEQIDDMQSALAILGYTD